MLKKEGLYTLDDGERYSMRVHLACALALFNVPRATLTPDMIASRCATYEHYLNTINVPLYDKYNDDVEVAMRNMTERLRYQRISDHGMLSLNSTLIVVRALAAF